MFYDLWVTTWHPVEPRLVWILRPGVTPLPAWPGILLGWERQDGKPPWMTWKGLVSYVRRQDLAPELGWFYPNDLRKITEEPPVCGGGNYPEPGPWSLK